MLSLGFTAVEHHLSTDGSKFIGPLAWTEETFIYSCLLVIPKENGGYQLSHVALPDLCFYWSQWPVSSIVIRVRRFFFVLHHLLFRSLITDRTDPAWKGTLSLVVLGGVDNWHSCASRLIDFWDYIVFAEATLCKLLSVATVKSVTLINSVSSCFPCLNIIIVSDCFHNQSSYPSIN